MNEFTSPLNFSTALSTWEKARIVLPYIGFLLFGLWVLWQEDGEQDPHS